MTLNHLFSPSLFDELFHHNLVACDGYILADTEALQKYKGFLTDRTKTKTAQTFKERKCVVDKIQALLKTSNPSTIEMKLLLKRLGLRMAEDGTVRPGKVVETKRDLGPSNIKRSLYERQIAARKESKRVQKRDLKQLDDWLSRISGPKARVKRAPERTTAEWKQVESVRTAKIESVLKEMARNRHIFVRKCYDNEQYKWISAMEKILDRIADSKKLLETLSRADEVAEADDAPEKERGVAPTAVEEEKVHLPSTDDVQVPEVEASDTSADRTVDSLEESESVPGFGRIEGNEFVAEDTRQKDGSNEMSETVPSDDAKEINRGGKGGTPLQDALRPAVRQTETADDGISEICPEKNKDSPFTEDVAPDRDRESATVLSAGRDDQVIHSNYREQMNDKEAAIEKIPGSVSGKGATEDEKVECFSGTAAETENSAPEEEAERDDTVETRTRKRDDEVEVECEDALQKDGSPGRVSLDVARKAARYSVADASRSHEPRETSEGKDDGTDGRPRVLSSEVLVSRKGSKQPTAADPQKEEDS